MARLIRMDISRSRRKMERTLPRSIQRLLVEGVETLHLTDELETVETGGLLDIGGDGAGFGAGRDEVVFSFDLWNGWSG